MNAKTQQAPTREMSFDHSDKHGGTYRATCRCEIDFRIQGLRHSVVQEHDHFGKQAVHKLIHQFEDHPNKGLQQIRAFNPFSEQSKDMIYSMGNMEYCEICEITPNIQCTNCMTYWPKGIVYSTCGTCLRPSDKVRKLNSDRNDVLSIPSYVVERDRPMGDATWEHGKTENLPSSPCLFQKGDEEGVQIYTG